MSDIDPFERYHALFALNMKHRFSQHPERQLDITRQLYQVAQSYYPPDHSATIDAMALYGDALSVYDPSQEAIDLLKAAYDMAVPKYGYDHFTTESIRRGLARVFGKLGRPEEGIPYALADVESAERSKGPTSFQYANALYELGRLYQYTKQHEEARRNIALALELRKNQWPKGHAQIVVAQVVLAQLHYELGDDDQALTLIDEIFEYVQDLRNARTYAAANSVRISIALKRNDEATAESLRQSTRQHMIDLGLTQEQIEQILRN
jgi:tetratricopeptide (TPR) repeat protein